MKDFMVVDFSNSDTEIFKIFLDHPNRDIQFVLLPKTAYFGLMPPGIRATNWIGDDLSRRQRWE
jgi:hypothetical protein